MFKSFLFFAVIAFLHISATAQQKNNNDNITLIRGPYLQVATTQSIIIRWRTNMKTGSKVRYGMVKNKLDKLVSDSVLATEHIVQLAGLSEHTRYYYSIETSHSVLQANDDNYFYTLGLISKNKMYRIGVFGDCGNNSINQLNVKKEFIKYLGNNYLDAWILLGDNAYYAGADEEFQQKFFNIYKDDLLKKYPLFPSPGNHDYNRTDSSGSDSLAQIDHKIAYYANFSMPENGEAGGIASHNQAFYSFDIGNIHFLSLDSYGKEENKYRLYDTLGPAS